MQLFYTPGIDPAQSHYQLTEEESKHCVRVLRMEKGDTLQLIDGTGGFYEAVIEDPHPKRVLLKITLQRQEYQKRNNYLHIAVAPTKNIERTEWFLEKATEIGIDEISLIICHHSERKEANIDRLKKIITSAMKQSLKAYHPKLNHTVTFNQFVDQNFEGQKFIAHCAEGGKENLKQILIPLSSTLIMIGPEGDFSPAEIQKASDSGFKAIALGNSRLRTETAALEACFEVNFLNRI